MVAFSRRASGSIATPPSPSRASASSAASAQSFLDNAIFHTIQYGDRTTQYGGGQDAESFSLRWLPRLIIGTAVVHITAGLALETPFGQIAEAGVIDSIDPYPERQSAFWYLMTGVSLLALGELARWTVRETGRVPARLGGWLVGMAVTGIVFMPASGFWLVAALGVIAPRAAREPERGAAQAPVSPASSLISPAVKSR